jgi:hypothetical protein
MLWLAAIADPSGLKATPNATNDGNIVGSAYLDPKPVAEDHG